MYFPFSCTSGFIDSLNAALYTVSSKWIKKHIDIYLCMMYFINRY